MTVDHRSRNARLRREKMRARLIEAALFVSAMRGPDAASIDEVAAAAGASRGSFYNYFFTLQELLYAASHELGTELITLVLAEIAPATDPADRLARGALLIIEAGRRYPLVARFAARMAAVALAPGSVAHSVLPALLEAGIEAGRFRPLPLPEACDLTGAPVLASLARLALGEEVASPVVVEGILRVLGLPEAEAQALANMAVALPPIADDSLLARTERVRLAREAG
jgi:AcrR family transcriptional regulator